MDIERKIIDNNYFYCKKNNCFLTVEMCFNRRKKGKCIKNCRQFKTEIITLRTKPKLIRKTIVEKPKLKRRNRKLKRRNRKEEL